MAVTEDALLANPTLAALLQKPYPPSIQYPNASGGRVTTGPVATSGPVADGAAAPRYTDWRLSMEGAGDFAAPIFRQSDWELYDPASEADPNVPRMADGSYWVNTGGDAGGYWSNRQPIWRLRPEAAGQYDWWGKAGEGSNSVNVLRDPNNPNSFSLQVKTADKQGTIIPYVLQGDQWVPQREGVRNVGWDTNDWGQAGLGMVLGAAGLGALLAPASAGGGAAAPAGSVAQSFPVAAPGAAVTSELAPLTAGQVAAGGGAAAGGAAAAGGGASAADIAALADVGMGTGTSALAPSAADIAALADVGMGTGTSALAPSAADIAALADVGMGTGTSALAPSAAEIAAMGNVGMGPGGAVVPQAGSLTSTLGSAGKAVLDFAKANPGLVASGIGALAGGASVPGPSGTTQNAAAGATNVADRYLQLADQQWLWQQQMEPQFAQTYKQLLDATLADAEKQRSRGDALWTDYTNIYRPLMEKSAADAMNYDNPAEVERRAGVAAATVAGQFDAAQGAAARERARAGVSSSSGRGAASELAYGKAGATAGAVNNERINAMLTGIALRRDQAGLGRSTEQAGLARDTAAMTAGKAAEGTMGNQVLTRNAMLSPRLQALMGANAAYGTASGIGNAEWAQRYQQQADRAGLWSQFGGAAARWLVDQFG